MLFVINNLSKQRKPKEKRTLMGEGYIMLNKDYRKNQIKHKKLKCSNQLIKEKIN